MGKIKKGIATLLLGAAGFFGMQQAADIADTAPKDASAHAAVSPETSMVELAEKLGCYARKRDPGFLLVGNGPVGLLEVTRDNPEENVVRLVQALDGVLMESVFYDGYEENGNEVERRDDETEEFLASMLRKPLLAGKRVLTIEYVKDDKTPEVVRRGSAAGYLTERAVRDLSEIPARRPQEENAEDVTSLKQAKNFLVLLNPERFPSRKAYIDALAATNYDLLIVDLYYNDIPLTPEETARLKKKANGGRRLLLSYMSIGETETYRPYWKDEWTDHRPRWIAGSNPEWQNNYKTRYWMKEWEEILFGSKDAYLDQIIAAGFDGAFLDVMDAWQYFKESGRK